MHSDVDLSCRIRERGYAMVYTPFAVLRHIGHLSLKSSDHLQERRKDKADTYLLKRWGHYLARDPWYPENMRAYLYHAGHVPYRMALVRQDDSMLDARDLLLVSHDLSLSGAPIMLLQLAERFRAQGHFVTVMSPQDGELASSYQALDIPVIIDATLSGEPDSQTAKLMAAFDLILANTIVAWPSVQVAHDSGTPVLWLLHESSAGQRMAHQNETIRRALIEADDVIFACAATRSLYAEFSNGSNYRTIPYGTQAPVVPPDLAPKGARTTFVHIGSIEPRKGQDLLLQALQRLDKSATEEMDFILIGRVLDVDYEDRIRPLLAATASARYLGALAHNEVIRALATADALICSSRDEVFPVTIMEAMALGKPVIATNVGGVSEMIRDGIDGLVVAPEDVQALATAITRMASDASDRERMGQAARQRFVETLTIERMAERLLDLIDSRLQAAHH
jgi:glycosyltransferase involved in cell wall biosynthesis